MATGNKVRGIRLDDNTWEKLQSICEELELYKCEKVSVGKLLSMIADTPAIVEYIKFIEGQKENT